MKLYHPLWTHSAAFALLLVIGFVLLVSLPVPGELPVHWGDKDATGVRQPDRYGPAWELPLAALFFGAMMVTISLALDGLAAQHRLRFNPLCLLDELIVGSMAATALAHLARVQGRPVPDAWTITLVIWGIVVPIALVLEALRPAPKPEPEVEIRHDSGDDERIAREVADNQSRRARWMYWESQCPGWVRWGMPVLGLGLVVLGVMEALSGSPVLALFVIIGVAMAVTCSGGMRVSVSRDELTVRIGYFGWRLLRMPLSRLTAAEVHAFDPLRDFGGYGLRWNREMRAYFFRGNRGVKITTSDQRRYLIGSDNPERLAAVIEAARRTPDAAA